MRIEEEEERIRIIEMERKRREEEERKRREAEAKRRKEEEEKERLRQKAEEEEEQKRREEEEKRRKERRAAEERRRREAQERRRREEEERRKREEEDEKKRREPDTMRTCYTAGGKNAVTAESVTPWQQINLYSDSSVTFHGKVEGEVWMEENGLHGQIVNGTDVRLGAGKLITSYGWRNLPALDPGGKAEFLLEKSTFKDPKNPQYENGGLYLENPSLYSVVGAATSYDSSKESVTADETASSDLISSMINGASDVLKRMHSNWSYGAYESALFMYCAEPESTGQTELYVDGKPVEQKTCKSLLSAELSFVAVGRTGVVFRSAGMDMPERMETDENLLPMNKPLQSAKQSYYHTLIDNPTFLFALKEMAGVKIESLQVLMDSYYAGQSRVYALNAQTRQWEEISINQDVQNPNRYLDEEGNLYLQFRGDTQDMYADIPTPMINLEGRVDHADN